MPCHSCARVEDKNYFWQMPYSAFTTIPHKTRFLAVNTQGISQLAFEQSAKQPKCIVLPTSPSHGWRESQGAAAVAETVLVHHLFPDLARHKQGGTAQEHTRNISHTSPASCNTRVFVLQYVLVELQRRIFSFSPGQNESTTHDSDTRYSVCHLGTCSLARISCCLFRLSVICHLFGVPAYRYVYGTLY